MQQLSKQPAFELGQIVATPGALAALKKAGQQPGEFLTRHVNREWGDLSDEDRKENGQPRARVPALERLPHTSWRQVVDYHGIGPFCDQAFATRRVLGPNKFLRKRRLEEMNATMIASGTKAVPPPVSSIQDIPLAKIRESKTNLRRASSFPLDSLGEQIYIPRSSRRDCFCGQTTGRSAGHAGHADLEGRFPRAIARLRHSAAHSTDFKRSSGDSAGLSVSGPVSS